MPAGIERLMAIMQKRMIRIIIIPMQMTEKKAVIIEIKLFFI
jgi:hypothetical protein